ncbi:MAG: acyltransferase family protein [Muribaculaceae bacterium]
MKLHPNKVPYKVPMPNNMGVMRYMLAIGVVVAHYNLLAGADYFFPISSYDSVGGFFALSGFLVYGSYLRRRERHERHSILGYVKSRALRILPAYFATVLFFAFALVAVSSLSAGEYFGSWHFWKYLGANLCFANFLEPTLPGVFEGLEMEAVNGSLWTMKIEWLLYLSVPVTAWLVSKSRNRVTAVLTGVYMLSAAWLVVFNILHANTGREVYDTLGRQFFGQLCYFYGGVLVYYWYDVLMRRRWLVAAVALLCYLAPYFLDYGLGLVLRPFGLAYLIIMLSMTGRWGTWEGKRDNVSYNMYLLHWPLIQVLAFLGLPATLGTGATFALMLIALVVLSVLVAQFVERPVKKFSVRISPFSGCFRGRCR